MATEQELKDSAAAHARATTKTWDWYLQKIRADPGYQYTNTEWYQAGADLQRLKGIPPTPQSPGLVFQNVVVVSDSATQAVNEAPTHYGLLFSADPRYMQWTGLVGQARGQGRPFLGCWCDCRTTLPEVAQQVAKQYALDTWAGQGESGDELATALAAECPLLVGNASGWTSAQRDEVTARIGQGRLSFAQEAYTNAGGPWPESTSSQGVPCASLCIGLYDASSEQPNGRYVSVAEYRAHTPSGMWMGISAYVSGVHPGELAQLP